jgi:hypothetical protein
MRRILPPLFIGVALAASVCSAYLALNYAADDGEKGLIADSEEHWFGTVTPTVLKHDFKLTNRTDQVVVLDHLVKSCGCTSASAGAKRLEPNASTVISCEMDTKGRRGQVASRVSVVYQAQGQAQQSLDLWLRAEVVPMVQLAPSKLEFSLGRSETKQINVSSSEPGVSVISVRCDHKAFAAKVLPGSPDIIEISFDASQWLDLEGATELVVETTHETERQIIVALRVIGTGAGN